MLLNLEKRTWNLPQQASWWSWSRCFSCSWAFPPCLSSQNGAESLRTGGPTHCAWHKANLRSPTTLTAFNTEFYLGGNGTGLIGQRRKEMLRNKEMNGAHGRRDCSTSSTAQRCVPMSPLGVPERTAWWSDKKRALVSDKFWVEPQLCNSYWALGPSSIKQCQRSQSVGEMREMLHCRTHRRCSVNGNLWLFEQLEW